MERTELILVEGKYTFSQNEDGTGLRCSRYGEPWREFLGDKAVGSLYNFAIDTQQRIADLEQKLTDLLPSFGPLAEDYHNNNHGEAGEFAFKGCPQRICVNHRAAIERSRQ